MGVCLHITNVLIVLLAGIAYFGPFWGMVSETNPTGSIVVGLPLFYNATILKATGVFEDEAVAELFRSGVTKESFDGDDTLYKVVLGLGGATALFALLNVLFGCVRARFAILSSLFVFLLATASWIIYLFTELVEEGYRDIARPACELIPSCTDNTIFISNDDGSGTVSVIAPFFAGYFCAVLVSIFSLFSLCLVKREDGRLA